MAEASPPTPDALLREADWIKSLARALSANSTLAEELEQEAWVAALRSRTAVRGALRPWLAQVMRNAARSIARSESARAARERSAARDERLPSAREVAERAEAQRIVVEEVLALPEPFRSAVLWCYVDGRSPAEVAEQLSIPAATVRSRLTRALARLRERLRTRLGPVPGARLGRAQEERGLGALALLLPREPARTPWYSVLTTAGGSLVVKKLVLLIVAALTIAGWIAFDRLATAPAEDARSDTSSPAAAWASNGPAHDARDGSRAAAPSAGATVAEPAATRKHRVRLVDERTDEPAPFFAVSVTYLDGKSLELATDAHGELLLEGAARLLLAENASGVDRIQTRSAVLAQIPSFVDVAPEPDAPEPLLVRIPLGPTYRLRIQAPGGAALADLVATLKTADPRQAFDSAFSQVRDGAPPWVRFRPSALRLGGTPPYRLEIATNDGLWLGAAEVPGNVGAQQTTVTIEFESRARLSGRVANDAGEVLSSQLVRIERAGASFVSTDNRPLFVRVGEGGLYDFRCIPPGAYVLRFEAEHHLPLELSFQIAPGEARELDLVPRRLTPEALVSLAGRVSSETGAFERRLYIRAESDEPQRSSHEARVEWSTVGGRKIGKFELLAAPGAYRLRLSGAGLLDVEPRELRWTPESPPPEFLVRDSGVFGSVVFRAHDPATGAALAPLRVRLTVDGDDQERVLVTSSSAPEARLDYVPIGQRCSYRVDSDGRQSHWGAVAVDASGVASIDAALLPGWSSEVRVVATDGRALEGARVWFDDVLVGVSGADGPLRVSLDREPRTARAELDGWRAVESSAYSAESGRFRSWLPWLTLTLERLAPPADR